MRTEPIIRHFAASLAMLLCLAGAGEAMPPEESILQVIVTYQEHDPFHPWHRRPPDARLGYGVAVGESIVLTTESLVRNATLVEVRAARVGEKTSVPVIMADPVRNMALLGYSHQPVGRKKRVINPAKSVMPGDTLEIVQFDATGQVERRDAHILNAAMATLPQAPHEALTYFLLSDLRAQREGTAVFKGNTLAGIVMGGSHDGSISMISAREIARFLHDYKLSPYPGTATAGFVWKQLIDPAQRRYLGVSGSRGVMVLACLPDSGAAESLKPGDVIVRMAGLDIDNMGFYDDPELGRLSLSYLISGRQIPGDSITVDLIRDGAPIKTSLLLKDRPDSANYIPDNITGQPDPYIVTGGLVIREVTGRYLQSFGVNWRARANPRLVHLYLTRRHAPEKPGDRVVVISSVLSDPINIGYHGLNDMVLQEVNGRAIDNIADVFNIIREDGALHRFKVHGSDMEMVLDRNALDAADRRISAVYRIPELSREPDL